MFVTRIARPLRLLVLATIFAFVAAGLVNDAHSTPNLCETAGLTSALVTKVLGSAPLPPKMSAISGEVPSCSVFGPSSKIGKIVIPVASVFLFPKSAAAVQEANQGKAARTPVTGLGSGGIFMNLIQVAAVDFTSGAYFVEVDGPPSARAQLEKLGRAIYANLH